MIKQKSVAISALIIAISLFSLSGCSQQSEENITVWKVAPECDLHQQSCTTKEGNSAVTLKIMPNPIPIARPLSIEMQIQNLEIVKAELDISGVNMYMGFNRTELEAQSTTGYTGKSMLAFCTTKEMVWQVTVILYLKDGSQIQVPHELITINRT